VNRTTIIHADVMQGLALLGDESVHMVMSSPPYWGQRDYSIPPSVWGGDSAHPHVWTPAGTRHRGGPAGKSHQRAGRDNTQRDAVGDIRLGDYCMCGAWRGQLGLEPTIDLYVQHVVEVFREVRRVLRKDGTFWLNIGDTYSSGGRGGEPDDGTSTITGAGRRHSRVERARGGGYTPGSYMGRAWVPPPPGVKSKELCLIPERLVIALQADGWWVRRDIIWAKDTCMPESCRDRPTTAHEYLWLLSKRPKYFYDALAIAEPSSPDSHARMKRAHAVYHAPGQAPQRGAAGPRPNTNNGVNRKVPSGWDQDKGKHQSKRGRHTPKQNASMSAAISPDLVPLRNKRSVWVVNPEPFPGAHFSTFPTKLVEPCILAGTSAKGVCPACAAPYARLVKVKYHTNRERGEWVKRAKDARGMARSEAMFEYGSAVREEQTLGWRSSCKCETAAPVPAVVLDCFGGAGTVALVANRLQRDAVLIEIKPEYIEMALRRIKDDAPLLADVQILKGGEIYGKEEARQETQAESSTRAGVLSKEGAPAGALS